MAFMPSKPATPTVAPASTPTSTPLNASSSSTRSMVQRPWTRLQQTLSLTNISLTQPELLEELLLRVPQMRNPLAPFPRRNKDSEAKMRAAVNVTGTSTAAAPPAAGGLPPAKPLALGGKGLLALATTNAGKEAEASKTTTSLVPTTDKKEGELKKLKTQLDGEFDVNSSMVEDALVISEEFGIDEVESYVLLRSMLWNKGIPLDPSIASSKPANPFASVAQESSEKPQDQTGNKAKTTEAIMKSFEEKNTRIERGVLIPMFRTYLGEEILALLRAITALCVACVNPKHEWHEMSKTVLPKIFDDSAPPIGTATTTSSGPSSTIKEKDAMEYVEMLLKQYSIRAGIDEGTRRDVKGKGKEVALLSVSALFSKPGTSATTTSQGSDRYRSTDPAQVLLEEHAILELLLWFLWAGFVPWSQAALPVLTLGYKSDLGLRQAFSSGGGGNSPQALSTSTNAYLYLEDKDKAVLKRIEMMWMLLCIAVFDIAHLMIPSTVLVPSSITAGGSGEDEDPEEYRRIYDPHLLPKIHAVLNQPTQTPRYAPILLTYAFLLSTVSQRAVQMGESLPKTYIPFLQLIIPDFSVDTIQERTSEIGRWMSSLLASFAVTDLSVLDYLETAVRVDEGGVFNGEGRIVGFAPVVYRVVVKRLVLAVSSFMNISLLPAQNVAEYLKLFTTVFGHGPSLPELAHDYWDRDIVNESSRAIFNMISEAYPLAGSAYSLNGSLEVLINIQRSLTGVGTWELEGGPDLSFMSRTQHDVIHASTSDTVGSYNYGAIAGLEASRKEAGQENARHVFHYLDQMETFSMVLQQSGPMGFRNFWDTYVETRSDDFMNGSNGGGAGEMFYTNLHPLALPGGTVMPARGRGRLISGGSGKPLIVRWEHPHSGWSLLLECLDECAGRLANPSAYANPASPPTFAGQAITQGNVHATPYLRKGGNRPVQMTLSQIGVDFSSLDIEGLMIDILDLMRSVLMHEDDVGQRAFFDSLGQGEDTTMDLINTTPLSDPAATEANPIVVSGKKKLEICQVVVRVLSDALARAGPKQGRFSAAGNSETSRREHRMITSAVCMLSLLARVLPKRVWPLMRSTGLLGLAGNGYGFGATPSAQTNQYYDRSNIYTQPTTAPQSTTAAVLASERATGSYNITLSILSLIRSLFDNSIETDIIGVVPYELKGEILLDGLKFIHTSIWCEFSGWRFKRLGDRFEIGKRIARLYCDILRNWTAGTDGENSTNGKVFRGLAAYLIDALILRAMPAALNPLVYILTIGQEMSRALKAAQRHTEDAELAQLLQSLLALSKLILAYKRNSPHKSRQSLFENMLCNGTTLNPTATGSRQVKAIPIDSIANLVIANDMGPSIPTLASETLSALVLSFAEIQPSSPSLVTHMSDAEETVSQLVRLVGSVYEHPKLRKSIWGFMANSVEQQPALATLFVTGSFSMRPVAALSNGGDKGKGKPTDDAGEDAERKRKSALSIAVQTSTWEELWNVDPSILCSIMRFLNAVWKHSLEHSASLDVVRKDTAFWTRMTWILKQGVSSQTDAMEVDRWGPSEFDDVRASAYHALTQAYAVEIFAIEVGSLRRSAKIPGDVTPVAPKTGPVSSISHTALKNFLSTDSTLSQHLMEAMKTSLDPNLHARLARHFTGSHPTSLPNFSIEGLQSPFSAAQRTYGTEYLYQVTLLGSRLPAQMIDQKSGSKLRHVLVDMQAVNCNWSLVDAQIELTRAWKQFLQEGGAILQADAKMQTSLFKQSVTLSDMIAKEQRTGKIMTIVHTERLGTLLALLQSSWSLSLTINRETTKLFTDLLRNVHAIVISETFPPLDSIRDSNSGEGASFHRQILQITYFCARRARSLFLQPSSIGPEQRAIISSTMLSITTFVATALSESIENAKSQQTMDLDRDMELLVTVFEQCTRPELHISPRLWLERVQELDLARSSLELLVKSDLGGDFVDGETLRAQRHPLYGRHMLALQHCLSSDDGPAETLAMAGAVSAYCNISIGNHLTVGTLSTVHPELPGDRNPGHQTWCTILSIVTGLVGAIGQRSSHFIETEVTSFIQFYGSQLSRALEWNVGEHLSSSSLEELENIMSLFYVVGLGVNPRSAADLQASELLRIFAEKSLVLVQHLNYALSHPNHLVSLFEPITSEERRSLDKELSQAASLTSVLDLLDVDKRPFIASLTQRLHVVVRNIMATLVIVNRGDEVIITEPEDWPSDVQIALTTKVTVGELATIGTFLELGNGIIDLLQHVKPSTRAKLPVSYATPPFDSAYDVSVLSQSLESIAVFTVAQLAVWQHQRDTGDLGNEDDSGMDWNDVGYGKESILGRLTGKRAPILAGLGGDVFNELVGMLSKAKTTLAKSEPGLDASKGMIAILEAFLNIRVIMH